MAITLTQINKILLKIGLLLVVTHSCDCEQRSNISFEIITAKAYERRPKI